MKKAICAVLAGTMLLTLCACGTKKTETSTSPAATASESVSPAATASASAAPSEITEQESLTIILDQINSDMEVGTAGSSLKATLLAASILDWGQGTSMSADDIKSAVVAWLSPKGNDEQTAFAEKYTAVKDAAAQLSGDNAKQLLQDAGSENCGYPWSDAAFKNVASVTEAVLGQN